MRIRSLVNDHRASSVTGNTGAARQAATQAWHHEHELVAEELLKIRDPADCVGTCGAIAKGLGTGIC